MRSALKLIYPSQCVSCGVPVEDENKLCSACWRDTPFIAGLSCASCGIPLLSDGETEPEDAFCDRCLSAQPPWQRGRAALEYGGKARSMALGLKNGGREDMAAPAAKWMAQAGRDLFADDTLLVPVPLHWWRLFRRRYNQSALLVQALARETGVEADVTALIRPKRTRKLDTLSRELRAQVLAGAIKANPRGHRMAGRAVLLIDDVHTTGATLSEAARAALDAGARRVDVLTLARAVQAA